MQSDLGCQAAIALGFSTNDEKKRGRGSGSTRDDGLQLKIVEKKKEVES
jgi:hypothetical protein